ncbi:hypothetical protein BN2475_160011 [Paraburkholderia ribeironis]|uniref:Uncharacterized protein n=1 Tax=Paraburkholderia ribeironis TaxID=1247936 RepID=A0A1N7RU62_9BURK|nr:hypothetical protein BN2475_160011 [Paraburkholderia ribeironis]
MTWWGSLVRVQSSLPTKEEREIPVLPGFRKLQQAPLAQKGEYGYDIANVDRNHFGATLVEDLFRHCSLQQM